MPSKLTKKYRKKNRMTKTKRGGGECIPENFGPFKLTKWGGLGGCGFNIYADTDLYDYNKPYGKIRTLWVDIDETGKIKKITDNAISSGAKLVKKVNDNGKEQEVALTDEELRQPGALLDIFYWGFYKNYNWGKLENKITDKTQLEDTSTAVTQGQTFQSTSPDAAEEPQEEKPLIEKKPLTENPLQEEAINKLIGNPVPLQLIGGNKKTKRRKNKKQSKRKNKK